ncbi:MAG: hypothetical protein IPJ86_04865 [Bacteroidetes bacterium]|nr:hypothetical protein [Bacteroidota bacterium]
MEEKKYRLDKSAFRIQTFEEASNNKEYWLSKSPSERWHAVWYLICSAYDLDPENPPRLDRSVFSMRRNG